MHGNVFLMIFQMTTAANDIIKIDVSKYQLFTMINKIDAVTVTLAASNKVTIQCFCMIFKILVGHNTAVLIILI